jgi:glycosyltransferase involved in cell wall biosynthesis
VQWLDWVSEREKLELLDRAAVLVCASLDEGFGFPALEAMARGCPVLASWAGSLPEVCGDAAVYVKPRDAEGIAAALLALVDTGPLRQTLVDRGLRRAAAFDWDASAAAHVRLFREVLASGAGGREAERPPAALGGEPPLDAAVQSGQ